MSKSEIQEKINQKARDMYDIADIFGKNLTKAIKVDDVLEVLGGCVCVPQQKMTELADLVKNRPRKFESCIFDYEKWLKSFVAKFVELTETEQREK